MTPPPESEGARGARDNTTPVGIVALAWLFVSAPLLWGVFQTLKKAAALFQ